VNAISFGDAAYNAPMLEIAGISVVMGNAISMATQAAKWSTATKDKGDVGLFLEKMFFL
jgi:hydroxymethylpyrimidine pyrophosphatase-like HAD family hydrolase